MQVHPSPGTGRGATTRVRAATLTPMEQRIFELVARGHSNKQIAAATCRSEETIKFHLKNLFQKLGARCRTEAVSRGFCTGLLRFDLDLPVVQGL